MGNAHSRTSRPTFFRPATVVNVSTSTTHSFSKQACEQVTLPPGMGVLDDAHCGETVKHRSRVARDPHQPNLRQVHFIHAELFEELAQKGFSEGALIRKTGVMGIVKVGGVVSLGSCISVALPPHPHRRLEPV